MYQRLTFLSVFAAATLTVVTTSLPAHADTVHVVSRGHTLEAIANRYHVSVKAIIEANHLQHPKRLRVGEELRIPDKASNTRGGHTIKPVNFAMKPKVPGRIRAVRVANNEEFAFSIRDRRDRITGSTMKSFERMMRSSGNLTHKIEPRLVALLAVVSNHFGGRKVEVISGFRPFSPKQYTLHSNHNIGKAIDFRIVGVPNAVVRDYCRTLRNVGVGYYPNSTFVHLDVRSAPAFWIDYARPGEPPRYNGPHVNADEGASDVEAPASPSADLPNQPALEPSASTTDDSSDDDSVDEGPESSSGSTDTESE